MLNSPLIVFLKSQNNQEMATDYLDWELLIRQARRANLLSRVAVILKQSSQYESLNENFKKHLKSAFLASEANRRSVKWEVIKIHELLHNKNISFCLLKGAAYSEMDGDASKGRIFSDIDILVRKNDLFETEKTLVLNGWFSSYLDVYKERYYREWMHELPPLRHIKRGTELDVHHAILPPTSRLKPRVSDLWASAISIPNKPGLFVLSPLDMVLHSATHLFHEGEFVNGLRDISDLDLLLKEYVLKGGKWQSLVFRAEELNLGRPLFYSLRYTSILLNTPIPESIIRSVDQFAPPGLMLQLMDALFLRALMPDHSSCNDRWTGLARWLLYVRSHWLRMPMHLLIPHLLRKSWMRLIGKKTY